MSTTDGSAKFEVRRADSVPVGAMITFSGGYAVWISFV